jgi:hypothetical protein
MDCASGRGEQARSRGVSSPLLSGWGCAPIEGPAWRLSVGSWQVKVEVAMLGVFQGLLAP